MKTPMQEMFDQLKASRKDEYGLAFAIDMLLENEQEMLEKERRAIVSAFAWGNITKVQYKSQHIAGEDYYNDRYESNT